MPTVNFAANFNRLWVLRKNGKIRALFSFEPTIARMAKCLNMPNDVATAKVFESALSGIQCGWETGQPEWANWLVITSQE